MATPVYGLPEWAAAMASPWLAHNQGFRLFEALLRGTVVDRDLTAPPGSCDDGAAYLVATSATGLWTGHDGEFAVAVGEDASNGWLFANVEVEGARLWVSDEGVRIQYSESLPGWSEVTDDGGASQTQTAECIAGGIASPSDKSYTLVLKAPHGGTITETTTKCVSGTCTATFKVNTTALGGTANSVSSSEQSQSHSSDNVFSAGDDIVLTVSGNSSCADLSFSIKYTRTLD